MSNECLLIVLTVGTLLIMSVTKVQVHRHLFSDCFSLLKEKEDIGG